MRQQWENSCILSSRLMTTPCARNATYEISRNRPIRTALTIWHSDADIEGFICRKLKSINECTSRSNMPKDGRERYVLFFKITSNVCNHSVVARKESKDWSILDNLECNRCATGDELHAQSFAFRNVILSKIQFLFVSIYFNAMQVIAWSKSAVLHLLSSYFPDNCCMRR